MEQHRTPETHVPPFRAHWTPAKQRIFLAALLESGSVACAARAAGMSRSSAATPAQGAATPHAAVNFVKFHVGGASLDAGRWLAYASSKHISDHRGKP
jgi:hypothetical protein